LCAKNKFFKNFEKQNTNLENVKRELLLARESLGKRPMEENQTLDNVIKENIGLRKKLSNSSINEKSLDL